MLATVVAFASMGEVAVARQAPAQGQPGAPVSTQGPGSVPVDQNGYQLAAGDVITVTVLRHPEFSGDYVVPVSGPVQVNGVGPLMLSGKTASALTDEITVALRKRLLKPEVTVNIKLVLSDKVMVVGDVKSPGPLDAKKGWHVAEFVNAAGGISTAAQPSDCTVVITKADGSRMSVPYSDIVANVDSSNVEIQRGDTILLVTTESITVVVMGKVQNQGPVQMRKDKAGILQAIAQAGGLRDDAALRGTKLIRADGQQYNFDLTPVVRGGEPQGDLPKVQAGDTIVVPEMQDKVSVLGAVSAGGPVPLQEGRKTTLAEVVAMSRADPARSRLSKVQLARLVNGKIDVKTYDIGRFFKTGNPKDNPELQAGDMVYIPESTQTNMGVFTSGLSVAALLFRSFSR